jgi:hypothetical protein
MNLNRCMRWTCGLPLFDSLPDVMKPAGNKPLKIVVIENEGSGGLFHRDTKFMYDHADFEGKEQIRDNLLVWGDGGYSGLKLDKPEHVKLIVAEAIAVHEPDVIFMEPFRGLHSANENDNSEISKVLEIAESMAAEYQIAVMLAHHEKKNGGDASDDMDLLRGATAFEGSAATIEHHRAVSGDRFRELIWSKMRYSAKPAPVRMHWNGARYWYEHVEESAIATAILTLLTNAPDAMTVAEIAEETRETQRKVRDVLTTLTDGDDAQVKRTRAPGPGQGAGYRIKLGEGEGSGLGV